MLVLNCEGLMQKYKQHWKRKLLGLFGSVLLMMLEIWALIPHGFEKGVCKRISLREL